MLPTRQDFKSGQTAGVKFNQRLEERCEFFVFQVREAPQQSRQETLCLRKRHVINSDT
jgi:hypothetical protein